MNNAPENKPFSQACENNKAPILGVIKPHLEKCKTVLEIGTGTGQHAVHFASALPSVIWQCSDQENNLPGIKLWLADAALDNTPEPLTLNVSHDSWRRDKYDAIFSANTAHIMHWPDVVNLFAGVGKTLAPDGQFFLYGPMNYNNDFSSESNARFDAYLKKQDPDMGIRDFEALNALAIEAGLILIEDFSMPANNQLLRWRKSSE